MAYHNPNPEMTQVIGDAYDRVTYAGVKGAKDTTLGVLASGFGKGAIAAFGLLIAGSALVFGAASLAGGLSYTPPGGVAESVGFLDALVGGASTMAKTLFMTPVGFLAAGVGGLAGTAIEYGQKQKEQALELAEAQQRQMERAQQVERAPEMALAPEMAVAQQPVQQVVQQNERMPVAATPTLPEPQMAMAQQPAEEHEASPKFLDRIKKRERAGSFVAEEENRRVASAQESRYQGVV